MDKRIHKRWKRGHSKRTKAIQAATGVRTVSAKEFADGGKIRIIYRPKTEEEAIRRVKRAEKLNGTPFLHSSITSEYAFTTTGGVKVKTEDVEMVFNDALFMDAVSNWGEDGPLYKDTLTTAIEKEVYNFAVNLYEGAEIPPGMMPPAKMERVQ